MIALAMTRLPSLRRWGALALALTICLGGLLAAGGVASGKTTKRKTTKAKTATVPKGFVGLNPADIDLPGVDANHQLDLIAQSGVRSLREPFYWSAAQPYKDWSHVPADRTSEFSRGGRVPTDFSATDSIVGAAATRHMTVLPVVLAAPSWDAVSGAPRSMPTPKSSGYSYYGAYLTVLIKRYGPHGSFWSENPGIPYLPIRSWQVWNEPNLLPFWATHPWTPSYISLLRVAHNAIKAADPGAKVVLGGLDNYSWGYISWIERTKGARNLFDVAAVHPYTLTAAGVMTILSRFRAAMNRSGDSSKPILITEFGWPSALGQTHALYGFEATPSTQASRLNALMGMIARQRTSLRLIGFYYYMWMGAEFRGAPSFNFAGLFGYRNGKVVTKPAFGVFRRWALSFDSAGG